ncbi:MAG: STAS domain-containing protein [Actinomycetota bacterium]
MLTIEKGADGRVLVLSGEIDMSNVQELVDAASELAEHRGLRLRMEGVSFIDSTGIRGLLRIAEMTGGELVLVSPHPAVRKVLRVLGLDATPPLRIVEER